jgi:hypothetical protein
MRRCSSDECVLSGDREAARLLDSEIHKQRAIDEQLATSRNEFSAGKRSDQIDTANHGEDVSFIEK